MMSEDAILNKERTTDLCDKRLNPQAVKAQFPIFFDNTFSKDLSYLDNAATTQKPESVIKTMDQAMRVFHSPVHRGFYALAEQSSNHYEQARARLQSFIGAANSSSCIFTSGATDSINQVAQGFLLPRLKAGQNVWVTRMEHHANFLPWQAVCEKSGANLRIIELDEHSELNIDNCPDLFSENTAMIALCYTSNVLGVTNNIQNICSKAKGYDIPVLVDAAQAICSQKLDVATLGCDFLAFSAHKMFGPTGIGLLYIAPERIKQMQAARLGGGMVDFVGDSIGDTSFSEAPHCFEAGSPNLIGAVGFAAACDFVETLGQYNIKAHNQHLSTLLYKQLTTNKKLRSHLHIVTPKTHLSSGIVSFYHDIIHAHDLAQILGDANIAVRAGHHCAQPLLRQLDVSSTLRISVTAYNTEQDIHAAVKALEYAEEVFA
jgi:cysteine desulfurase/selenocysteine lyase